MVSAEGFWRDVTGAHDFAKATWGLDKPRLRRVVGVGLLAWCAYTAAHTFALVLENGDRTRIVFGAIATVFIALAGPSGEYEDV